MVSSLRHAKRPCVASRRAATSRTTRRRASTRSRQTHRRATRSTVFTKRSTPFSPTTTTRCALAPVLPSGQNLSERLLAGGRRRRRSRGRVRAWRSSRERIADASSRHLAVSQSRRLAVVVVIHAPSFMILYRTPYIVMPFYISHFLRTTYSYYSTCTMHRFYVAWPRESSHSRRIIQRIRPAAAPSVLSFIPMCCRSIRVAFTSRCDLIIMRRSTSALIQLRIIFHRAVCRGFDRTPAPRPCALSVILSTSFPRVDSPAASLEILFVLLLATR